MTAVELTSNLKLITSGNVPTTSTLANGEVAFGIVGGFAKMYGNVNNVIIDLSNFLRTAPVASVAGKTGVVTLTKADVGLSEVNNTSDVSKNVHGAYTFLGKDTRNVNSPPSYYLNGGIATKVYEFKSRDVIQLSSTDFSGTYVYLETLIPWYDASGGYPVQIAMQNNASGVPKIATRCGVSATSWSAWSVMASVYRKPVERRAIVINENLSGVTLKFNTSATYPSYFTAVKTFLQSSGGYTIQSGGPPHINIIKNGTSVQQLYTYTNTDVGTWSSQQYTLPSDFGTVTSLDSTTGGTAYTSLVDTMGVLSTSMFEPIDVQQVYEAIQNFKVKPSSIAGNHFRDVDADLAWAINKGTMPSYPGTSTNIPFDQGIGLSQGFNEASGIWIDGNGINMWSPCDRDALTYYDEDNGEKVFRVDAVGIVYRKDGKRALYEGEGGGVSAPYKTTISSWSGSVGNYTSTINASTHGKGTDPQVETFIGTTRYYDDYDIATNGDITFRSSANISLNIKIR